MANSFHSTRPLGLAVWGIGAHAQRTVLPAIAESHDVRLVGIHTRNHHVLENQSQAYGCLGWTDPIQMLESYEVDVVYLSTPTALHFEHARQVLRMGKHLWCEKPLATRLVDADQLIEDAKSLDRSLAVVCGPRYHPQFFAVREQITKGALGELRQLSAAFHFPHIDPVDFRYNPELGGGALLDVGFYLLSVIDALVPGNLIELSCNVETEPGYHVDTIGTAVLGFDDGVKADLSWRFGGEYKNLISITGSAGDLVAEPFFSKPENLTPIIKLRTVDGSEQLIEFDNRNQFIEMFRRFSEGARSEQSRSELMSFAHRSQFLLDGAERASKHPGTQITI